MTFIGHYLWRLLRRASSINHEKCHAVRPSNIYFTYYTFLYNFLTFRDHKINKIHSYDTLSAAAVSASVAVSCVRQFTLLLRIRRHYAVAADL